MKRFIFIAIAFLLTSQAYAEASRDDIQQAFQHATLASMFSLKAKACNWDSGGMDWDELRTYSVALALAGNEAGKKLNTQQTTAIASRISTPSSLELQQSLVDKSVANGVCKDASISTNEQLWRQTVELAKVLKERREPKS